MDESLVRPKDIEIIRELEKMYKIKIVLARLIDSTGSSQYSINEHGNINGISLCNVKGFVIEKTVDLLSKLKHLETLYLTSNKIKKIEHVDRLHNLTSLNIGINQIQKIENLETLIKLKSLIISFNQIQKIENLDTLINLEELGLHENKIKKIENLETLTKLKTLYLYDNDIQKLENLGSLRSLKRFSIFNNKIKKIENLDKLYALTQFYVFGNPIHDLKVPINENNFNLVNEYLKKQEQSNLPQTTARSKTQPLLEKTALHILQLMLLGNGEAGKTSVLRTLRTACLNIEEKDEGDIEQLPEGSTHGNIHYYWDLSKGNRKKEYLLVKDFGGQEYYHHFHPVFYHPNALYWIVTTPKAAEDANKREENGSFAPSYWLENVRHSLRYFHKEKDSFNAWLLLNKADKQKQEYLDSISLNGFRKFFTLSSDVDNDEEEIPVQYQVASERLYYTLKEHIAEQKGKEEIDMFSKKIFEKLNSMNEEDKQQYFSFSIKEFQKFLKSKKVVPASIIDDYTQLIINDLRLLGICIYIEPDEDQDGLVFLFPQQLTLHIFNNILTKEVRDNKPKGEIPEENFEGNDKLKELLKHFEVIFQDGETKKWIAPQFLPNEYSDADMMAIARDGLKEKLVLKFKNYMPKGIMSRLVAYFGRNPFKKWYWRDGILFTHDFGNGNTKGMITADWEQFTITIEAPNTKDLIDIYKCVLLAFFNKPVERYIPHPKKDNEEEQEEIKEDRKHMSGTDLKTMLLDLSEGIEISIAYNNTTFIPLKEFRKWIGALKPTFNFMPEEQVKDELPKTHFVKVYEHLPYISYLINTKKFEEMYQPKKLFISYSHDDIETCTKIKNHIRILERQGYVSTWTDAMIEPGSEWDKKIETALREADVVLLLMSESFFASEYIWNRELEIINEKLKSGNAIVMPILCRHCLWNVHTPFDDMIERDSKRNIKDEGIGKLQAMPVKNGRLNPIHSEAYPFIDEAYTYIADKLKSRLD